MWRTWLQREDPPWKPELFQFFLRSRLPWITSVSLAILLTVDTGAALPWLLTLLGGVAVVNVATYRRHKARVHVPAVMGLIDIVSPMIMTIFVPGLAYPALTISVMAAILARLAYGPRTAAVGVALVIAWATVLNLVHPMPWLTVAIAVYFVTATRAVIGLGVLTRREMRIAARLQDLVDLDELTGLFNRASFVRRLTELLAEADAATDEDGHRHTVGLLYLDLDRFKEINDGLGHHHGDLLLVEVGERLRATVPRGVVARMGGDEFAIVVPGASEAEMLDVGLRVCEQISAPITLDDLPMTIGASVGIALAPDHGHEAAELIKRADIAMYQAKVDRGTVAIYRVGSDIESSARVRAISGVRDAVAQGQLCLAYQPVVDLHTGEVRSFEALVRWDHPERGVLPPSAFVELAEMTGAISDITRWVLRQAVADCAAWNRAGYAAGVSVNLSMVDLERKWLGDELEAILRAEGMAADLLTLELTETASVRHLDRVAALLGDLAGLGVRLSVDDFGAGHTSLTYLRELPVDQVKIDRAFIAQLDDPMSREIVAALVGLGERVGLDIVAEGLEDAAMVHHVAALGCRYGQGYQLGRPLPISAIGFGPMHLGSATTDVMTREAAPSDRPG